VRISMSRYEARHSTFTR